MKNTVVIVLLFCLSNSLSGQERKISFGPKLGINFSSVTGGMVDGLSPRVAFQGGGFFQLPISEKFSVLTEVLYSAQGEYYDGTLYTANIPILGLTPLKMDAINKLDYLNVPLLANYHFSKNWSVQAGLQFGFLLASNIEGDLSLGSLLALNGDIDEKLEEVRLLLEQLVPQEVLDEQMQEYPFFESLDAFKTFDVSIAAGGTYNLNNGLFFQGRCTYSLTNSIAVNIPDRDWDRRNIIIQLSAGYAF